MKENEPILIKAEFNPIVKTYIMLYVFGILLVTVVGIPFAIVWICGLGQWYSRHYYEKLYCVLTEKHLRFRMGILFTIDKTIPLENIQDLTFYEGPVLRHFNLAMLKVETAGQGDHSSNQMKLVGVVDAHVFRSRVLEQREAVKMRLTAANQNDPQIILLEKIAATLERIESGFIK
ncbi:MAG TPA: PH domain-containing protein [Ignavibacteria bacterium]|nr:PH domain-containing protein [Ignavibacteria bacterium]